MIARSILLSANLASHRPLLVPNEPDLIRLFLGNRAEMGWLAIASRRHWTRRCLMAFERLLLHGIIAHYLARKRWIERETRLALEGSGVPQVVIIGAGYDTLGWRLAHENPGLECFELDHPATQQPKRAASGAAKGFHLLPVDLSTELPDEILAKCPSFDSANSSVVIVEGVTMYLHPAQVARLLGSCGRIAGPRGRVIFTFMEKTAEGSIGFRLESSWISRWLRWKKEPFRWGSSREEIPGILKSSGLRVKSIADHHTLRAQVLGSRGLGELPLARGECLCLCQPILS